MASERRDPGAVIVDAIDAGAEESRQREKIEASARIYELAFEELYRVFRSCLARFGEDVRVTFTTYASGEPHVAVAARGGLAGSTLAWLIEEAGQDLEVELDSGGSVVFSCPSWPVPF